MGLEFLYFADDEHPWVVMMQLYWPEPRED